MRYEFRAGEPGIWAEIYLPKRSEYQGTLYETLSKGLNLSFHEHFMDPAKKDSIQKLLNIYTDISSYNEKLITSYQKKFPNIFSGYSMYEVDGVFKSWEIEDLIYEERTQVIKIFFVPNYDVLYKKLKNWKKEEVRSFARKYFRNSQISPDSFKKTYEVIDSALLEKKGSVKIIKYLNDYINCAGLIVFGYIVYEVTQQLLFLLNQKNLRLKAKKKRKTKKLKPLEEEIWVTSIWGFTVNKIIFKQK